MEDTVIVQQGPNYRAVEVKMQLEKLQNQTENDFFDICDLLQEAKEKSYHISFGFVNFNEWVESMPSLDMSASKAQYCINISTKALRLNVDRPTLKKVKVTKLREIFSLDPDIHLKAMSDLIEAAPAMSIEEVKNKVKSIKQGTGFEEMAYMTVKFPISAKTIIDSAFDKVRMSVGGEVTNGKALELVCADYLGGEDPQPTEIVIEEQDNVPCVEGE